MTTTSRLHSRPVDQLRPTVLTPHYLEHAEGSVLIEAGRTRVICTASVEDKVPPFLRGTGKGWVTAEYGMLPRATSTRTTREASRGKVGGRTQEIQRLIAQKRYFLLYAPRQTGKTSVLLEMMEALKSKAPFWKKEALAEGGRWVENNTPGE